MKKEYLEAGSEDKGFCHDRVNWTHGNIEKAFYEHWKKENTPVRGINSGNGVLQGLLTVHNGSFYSTTIVTKVTKRDRFIVATVMQWVGTNVGFCFLRETLRDCGYTITKNKENE